MNDKITLSLSDFYSKAANRCYLESVSVNRELRYEGVSPYHISMTLCEYPYYEGSSKLLLVFSGVRDLRFQDMDGLIAFQLRITDISGDQLEGINYKLTEAENNIISFYFEDFDFYEIF